MLAGTHHGLNVPGSGSPQNLPRWTARKHVGREELGEGRPGVQGEQPDSGGSGGLIARIAGIGALIVAAVLAVMLLFGGDDGHKYNLLFETGGQLVPGNEVLVGGQPIGIVDEISLTDDAQAEVKITVDEPLHEGTTAIIRSTSLSGIANRYVSISPGPQQRARARDRRPDPLRQDDRAGRPRPALQHLRPPHPHGAVRTSSRATRPSTPATPRRPARPTSTSPPASRRASGCSPSSTATRPP